jgi:hypothetical protein
MKNVYTFLRHVHVYGPETFRYMKRSQASAKKRERENREQ